MLGLCLSWPSMSLLLRWLTIPLFSLSRYEFVDGVDAYGSFAFRWPCMCAILRMKKRLFYPPPTILLKLNSLASIYRLSWVKTDYEVSRAVSPTQ